MLYLLYKNNPSNKGAVYFALGRANSINDWLTSTVKTLNITCQDHAQENLGLVCARCLTPELEDFLEFALGNSPNARTKFINMMTDLSYDQPDYEYCEWDFTPADYDELDLIQLIGDLWGNVDTPI